MEKNLIKQYGALKSLLLNPELKGSRNNYPNDLIKIKLCESIINQLNETKAPRGA